MDTYKKKYKGALARCKWLLSEGMISRIAATDLFRELMDNDSENVKREIINIFHSLAEGKIPVDINYADIFTWLEKQGEQKPTLRKRYKNIANSEWFKKTYEGMSISDDEEVDNVNNIEPKFKVGDWIVNRLGNIWHIDSFDTKNYQVTTNKGEHNYFPINIQDRMHIWTIADAKDGDILCTPNGNTFIFKTIDGDKILDYCGLYFNKFFSDFGSPNGSSTHYDKCNYHPATKEQRDLLFAKMKEAGYEWDAENLQLTKIFYVKELSDGINIDKQKLAEWSEEDDWIKTKIIKVLLGCETFLTSEETNECIDWIKSIKQRLKGKS